MHKITTKIISFLLATIFLCGCQQTPSNEIVTSKNDGVLQDKIKQTIPSKENAQDAIPVSVQWTEQFTSTDDSVIFSVDISDDLLTDVRNVVEVTPHRLTEKDIQNVAKSLLGDVDFYERRSSSKPEYSKSQYQAMINRLSAYASREALVDLMGESDADVYLEYVQLFIEQWTSEYEAAQDADPRLPCDWSLKKERHYNDSEVEIGNRTAADDSDVLYANAEKNGIEYNFSVVTKDGSGYKVNSINLNLTEGLGLYPVDMAIYRSKLCRTDKPTDDQVKAVKDTAQNMLNDMNLGKWSVIKANIVSKQIDDVMEYVIHITAVPSFDNVSAIYGQKSENLQNAYSATYLMSSAEFEFSANGDILFFSMNSPVDIVAAHNDNVATMPIEELVEACKQQLVLSDADAFGLPLDVREEIEMAVGEGLLCKVTLMEVEYGLGRVKVPDSDDNYYYIPVMAFKGIVEYVTEKTNALYYRNLTGEPGEDIPILVSINAIDGSII